MNFDELKEDIEKNKNGQKRVLALLEGDAADFECTFPYKDDPNVFVIKNTALGASLNVSLFNDRQKVDTVQTRIEVGPNHGINVRLAPDHTDGTYNTVTGAVLHRLPKSMLLAWVLLNFAAGGATLRPDAAPDRNMMHWVRSDYRWFIEMETITLYELTEAGRARLQDVTVSDDPSMQEKHRAQCSPAGVVLVCGRGQPTYQGLALPLAVDDLKPVFQAYHALLDAHRWEGVVTLTREERLHDILERAKRYHDKVEACEKAAGLVEVALPEPTAEDRRAAKRLKRALRAARSESSEGEGSESEEGESSSGEEEK